MAQLVSAGVSVTITDESFFIPASSPTVPLFFIASNQNKTQPDGISIATGTTEHSVVRTVTSLGQSVSLFGIPYFRSDSSGNEYHGDARNEYGLFALNQYLGIGNRAYVVRANVDLADKATTFINIGSSQTTNLNKPIVENVTFMGVGNGTISGLQSASVFVQPDDYEIVFTSSTGFTVQGANVGIIGTGTVGVAFTSSKVSFTINAGTTAFSAGDYFAFSLAFSAQYTGTGNGAISNIAAGTIAIPETWTITFTSATAYTVQGSVSGLTATGVVGFAYDNGFISFMINAGTSAFVAGDEFVMVLSSVNLNNPLGANDAAKRVAITTALQAEVNSNMAVRSEIYEYNLILCPGYPELVDELVALSQTVNDEAFVIGDTPVDKTPEQTAVWAKTSERTKHQNVAYYYPWGLASNLDGRNVCVAPSGIALRTYANSDNQSYLWFAPAGVRRGVVTGVSKVGYVSGSLGTATTFIEADLNQGQRDNLYEYFTNINPIVFFPDNGLIVFGQKTSYGAASALDRVNVMRMLMYIKRQLRKNSFAFLFEPNDKITRDNFKSAVDGFLHSIMVARGLYDFATLCDESNNTTDRVNRNEMWMDVGISPIKAAEFIYIPLRVTSANTRVS